MIFMFISDRCLLLLMCNLSRHGLDNIVAVPPREIALAIMFGKDGCGSTNSYVAKDASEPSIERQI